MKYIVLYIILIFSTLSKTIIMGYRTTEIPPLINADDNKGLYKDLYEEAFRRLGYKLEIVRLPKLRIIDGLKDGSIDFYPRFNFTLERSSYIFFIENGLFQKDVLVTTTNVNEDIENLTQIENMVFGKSLGAPSYFDETKVKNLKVVEYAELDLERSINMLLFDRIDFTIFDYSSLVYYLKEKKIKNIKIHENFLKKKNIMYLGFSKNSIYFTDVPNEKYNPREKLSIHNYPTKLKEGSLPFLLQQVLQEMLLDGTTEKFFNKYYK